ncbi:unnamed protein product [Toxocara canis]|uniref:G protein-coupled receptor n=1 Tax=Toxocara canis TaxID=6265 RepID=A0A183UU29_TOXCA|nr:unnamed protein product [Toxocara canis]
MLTFSSNFTCDLGFIPRLISTYVNRYLCRGVSHLQLSSVGWLSEDVGQLIWPMEVGYIDGAFVCKMPQATSVISAYTYMCVCHFKDYRISYAMFLAIRRSVRIDANTVDTTELLIVNFAMRRSSAEAFSPVICYHFLELIFDTTCLHSLYHNTLA